MTTYRSRGAIAMSIVKTVLLFIIAIAMVKFAFFPAQSTDEAMPLDPAGSYGQITITPERGTITNTVTLEGTIQSDPAPAIKATLAGEITEIYVNNGDQVSAGDTILLIQKEMEGDPIERVDEEGNKITEPGKNWWKNEWVTAPTSGKINLTALLTQQVNVGESLGSVQPPTFSAVATLTPDQMYRVQNLPDKATITIKNGPAPFECNGVRIDTPQNRTTSNKDGDAQGNNSSTSIEARCAVPDGQTVFPGLQVTMALIAGEAADVMTVPISAVEGRFEQGTVYGPAEAGGQPVKIPVKLGLTDGKRVQIIEGLKEDQEILEFVPGKIVEDKSEYGMFMPGDEGMMTEEGALDSEAMPADGAATEEAK
ncbi:efflux RND transporter periplasmic adaptor subunit [Schaalia sp. Marseille-Q2122]|uniref:efflux RND transporter periplasmic adaptor subunit n=1 Tax=Schaalia sp. Marseille-Q2122 TaxID=2736604 RepID=UPI001589D582|nr:biotin/lipoyl-binding protein [Schaalia sp. Marseille-Q2122]